MPNSSTSSNPVLRIAHGLRSAALVEQVTRRLPGLGTGVRLNLERRIHPLAPRERIRDGFPSFARLRSPGRSGLFDCTGEMWVRTPSGAWRPEAFVAPRPLAPMPLL